MNEFKSPFRVIGGEKGNHCFYPAQIDMAGKGCTGGCSFCYARSLLEFRGNWDSTEPAIADIEKVRKLFENAFDYEKTSKDATTLREAKAIRIGGMTDPLLINPEGTMELLDLCDEYNKKYLMFTKGIITDNVIEHLRDDLAYVQISISTTNQEWLDKCEPGTSTAQERLDSIVRCVDNDVRVAARIGPLIPDPVITNHATIDDICSIKPDVVIGEMIRFSGLIAKQMLEIGYDIKALRPDDQIYSNGATFYSVELRDFYYKYLSGVCENYGIDFSVCELDNFEYFKKYWSNNDDCCAANWK